MLVYDAIVSLIILKVIDVIIGLRVTKEIEREGLDLALHGEAVQYTMIPKSLSRTRSGVGTGFRKRSCG